MTTEFKRSPLDGEYTVCGTTFLVEVSPCSFMYPHYGLQVGYTSRDKNSWGYLLDRKVDAHAATRQDVQNLLDTLTPRPCKTCAARTFYNPGGNRGELCDTCFMSKIKGELDRSQARERDELAARDAGMKRKGFTHRVTAWVHPPRGDDYQIDIYTRGEPQPKDIEGELKKKRSRRLDDYHTTAL